MHTARDAREPGDRGAGRHQRVHHRAQPRHEDHRGGRQVSAEQVGGQLLHDRPTFLFFI